MHSLDCLFILFFRNIGSGFNVKKIIKVGIEIFLDLWFDSYNRIVKIFFGNVLWRDCFWLLFCFLSFLLCLWFVLCLLAFRWLLIRLALSFLSFGLWLFLRFLIDLFGILLRIRILILVCNFLVADWVSLWFFFFLILLIWVSEKL